MKKAFSLLEVLLALSIASMIMLACTSLLFSMMSLLNSMENSDPIDKHINSVEKFLKSAFINSSFPADTPSDIFGDMRTSDGTIRLGQYPNTENYEDMNLCFGIIKDHPFFPSNNGFSREKICWLKFNEDEGLSLVWTFVYLEEEESERKTYESLISKYVKGINYWYYSEQYGWEVESDLNTSSSNAGTIPYFIELIFKTPSEDKTRMIALFSSQEIEQNSSSNISNMGGRNGIMQAQ